VLNEERRAFLSTDYADYADLEQERSQQRIYRHSCESKSPTGKEWFWVFWGVLYSRSSCSWI